MDKRLFLKSMLHDETLADASYSWMMAGLTHTKSIEYSLKQIVLVDHQITVTVVVTEAMGATEEVESLVIQFLIMELLRWRDVELQMRSFVVGPMAVLVGGELVSFFHV